MFFDEIKHVHHQCIIKKFPIRTMDKIHSLNGSGWGGGKRGEIDSSRRALANNLC